MTAAARPVRGRASRTRPGGMFLSRKARGRSNDPKRAASRARNRNRARHSPKSIAGALGPLLALLGDHGTPAGQGFSGPQGCPGTWGPHPATRDTVSWAGLAGRLAHPPIFLNTIERYFRRCWLSRGNNQGRSAERFAPVLLAVGEMRKLSRRRRSLAPAPLPARRSARNRRSVPDCRGLAHAAPHRASAA
jgi:hypothetical protein